MGGPSMTTSRSGVINDEWFATVGGDGFWAATDPDYPASVQTFAQHMLDGSQYFIAALTLSLAYLMVSRFQYPHLFQQLLRGRRAPHQIGQALFVVIGALVLHWLALPIAFCYYAFASPIRTLIKRWRKRHSESAPAS